MSDSDSAFGSPSSSPLPSRSSTPSVATPKTLVLHGNNQGVGLANPQLSEGRRQMLDLVNKLHSTGVQVDIDLPQIAVIGSQSAGKSSLIESISGITLPRAAGTCTRCPTECRLSRGDSPWKCIVTLRFITDAQGQPLGQASNQPFGPVIYDKAEVEDRIRRAQRAILNPSKPSRDFLKDDDGDDDIPELSFSMNCVSLQISGPDVADLSFCDLPGLIASVSSGRGDNNDIALVQNLVTSYIKKPSCIILLTVACETDFENQGAHRLTKQYDPDGKRTIGVLTKPDRIPAGEEANWLPFIRNEKEPLDNNWYCVKQPSSNDIKQNVTWTQARKKEHDFFSMTTPWCELDAIYQKYLRTSNLVDRLSSILSDLISKRLPEIQDELERSIVHTRKLIGELPKPPSNDPSSEVMTLMHTFSHDLLQQVIGVPDTEGLLQKIRPSQNRFRRAIRLSAPNFRPFERKDAANRHLGPAIFLKDEEGEVYEGEASDDDDSMVGQNLDDLFSATVSRKRSRQKDDTKIYIDEVLDRAHQARTRELPGNFPFIVQKTYITDFLKQWREPAMLLCQSIYSILSEGLKALIRSHFNGFGQGHLEQRVRTLLQQHLKECYERTETKINWLLDIEEQPFSLNNHYFSDYKTKFLTHYRGSRRQQQDGDLMQTIASYEPSSPSRQPQGSPTPHTVPSPLTGIAAVLAGLTQIGLHGVNPEDIAKLLPPDRMEPALTIMADVRAYFQVAYKRFTDLVPLAIDHELVRGIEREALKVLYSGLGIQGVNGHRICKELVQESPQIADRRADLVKKLERLEVARTELLRVGL